MKTRPPVIAADDLTGPPVLKLQRRDNLSGRFPGATPVSAGLPRNMGQEAPLGAALAPSPGPEAPASRVATRFPAAERQIVGRTDFICRSVSASWRRAVVAAGSARGLQ